MYPSVFSDITATEVTFTESFSLKIDFRSASIMVSTSKKLWIKEYYFT